MMAATTPERLAELETLRERLRPLLQPGTILTHTRCMGRVEEHHFAGWDGNWIFADTTCDSIGLGVSSCGANDISVGNITHVNRVPISDFLEQGETAAGVSFPTLDNFLDFGGAKRMAFDHHEIIGVIEQPETGLYYDAGTYLLLKGGHQVSIKADYNDVMRRLTAHRNGRFDPEMPF